MSSIDKTIKEKKKQEEKEERIRERLERERAETRKVMLVTSGTSSSV